MLNKLIYSGLVLIVFLMVISTNANAQYTLPEIEQNDNSISSTGKSSTDSYSMYHNPIYNFQFSYPTNAISTLMPLNFDYVNIQDPRDAIVPLGTERSIIMLLDDTQSRPGETAMDTFITIQAYNVEETERLNYAINFFGGDPPSEFTIDEVRSSIQNTLLFHNNTYLNYRLITSEIGNLGDIPGIKLEYSYFNPILQTNIHQYEMYLIVDNTLIILELSAKENNYAEAVSVFNYILETFEYLG